MVINLIVNGLKKRVLINPDEVLLDTLRKLGYTSVKRGCDTGACGLCTVLVDGKPKEIKKNVVAINNSDKWSLIWLVFIQVIFVTMVYGPIEAFLVEMFPAKIRYTSMSLPYHIGNGIFGGLLPAVATYLVTSAKDAGNPEYYLQGLWYPIIVAAVSLIIGVIYLDGKDRNVED